MANWTTDDRRSTTDDDQTVGQDPAAGLTPEVGKQIDVRGDSPEGGADAGTELAAAIADQDLAGEMAALDVDQMAEAPSPPLITLAATEPPEAPDALGETGEPQAIAAAVEAELMEDELATLADEPQLPYEAPADSVVTSEGEAAAAQEPVSAAALPEQPELSAEPPRPVAGGAGPAVEAATPAAPVSAEKPRRRGKKAREAAPGVAEAVERLSQASEAAFEPPPTLPQGGPLSVVAQLESLLFVADGPVPVARLAEALEIPVREVEAALGALAESYQQRGLSLQRFRDRVQLTTAPAAAPLVERFLGLTASTPLSRAALEALAIIAYQQPVTRPQIEAVRGVNSDSVIKNLLTKGLIEEAGRAEGPGRPVLYSTTTEFMQHFGLGTLSDLPPLALPTAETPGETISELLKG